MAAILVDTHILLWARISPQRLSSREREAIEAASPRYVSAVSLWEIAILISLGRVAADDRLLLVPVGFELLPVSSEHCKELVVLPQHHRDPFDRMLIAQARAERLALITRDRALTAYRESGITILHHPRR